MWGNLTEHLQCLIVKVATATLTAAMRFARDLMRFTSADQVEHLISLDAHVLGRLTGYYVTLCNKELPPASLTVAPLARCTRCQHSPLLT